MAVSKAHVQLYMSLCCACVCVCVCVCVQWMSSASHALSAQNNTQGSYVSLYTHVGTFLCKQTQSNLLEVSGCHMNTPQRNSAQIS